MVIESLNEYLLEQLELMPTEDSDRAFIQKVQSMAEAHLQGREYLSPTLRRELQVADLFFSSRKGAFLEEAQIRRIPRIYSSQDNPDRGLIKRYSELLIRGIKDYGNDSIAHLLLPRHILTALDPLLNRTDKDRANIAEAHEGLRTSTITKLRDRLNESYVYLPYGPVGIKIVNERLTHFDRLVPTDHTSS